MNSIYKWDYFLLKNNPDSALSYYLQVAEKLPNDTVIKKKIAHTYVLKKDWQNAYQYYHQVPLSELKEFEREELLAALFLNENQKDRMGEFQKFSFWTGEVDYYRMVDICYSGIHNCIVHISSYSGTSNRLMNLKSAITDAEKVSPDYQFRNFTIATQLFLHGDYRASFILADEILRARPDYYEVLKLAGFSAYELWKFIDAQNLLLKYLEWKPADLDTIVKLGEINFLLGDYISSNLYFNNAIVAGYTPKTDLERRLAYNYSLLGDTLGMIKVLSYLLQEPDVTEDDFAVAVSLALGRGENIRAFAWIQEWLQKFPDSPLLFPLSLSVFRVNGQVEKVLSMIDSATGSLAILPTVRLEKWILLSENPETQDTARSLFEDIIRDYGDADFALEAKTYLQNLQTLSGTEAPSSKHTDRPWWF